MARLRWNIALQTWVPDTVPVGSISWDQVGDKPVQFPPTQHVHTYADLPNSVPGVAVGTNTARPAAGLVIWFAAEEPPAAVETDFVIINPIYG